MAAWAKHFMSLQKKDWEHKMEEYKNKAKDEVISKLEKEISIETKKSEKADKEIRSEIDTIRTNLQNITIGMLSMQGKQFRDTCRMLLKDDHEISIVEYEQFEEDYYAYKNLGGNHRGDALHDRVVAKFNEQIKTKNGDQE